MGAEPTVETSYLSNVPDTMDNVQHNICTMKTTGFCFSFLFLFFVCINVLTVTLNCFLFSKQWSCQSNNGLNAWHCTVTVFILDRTTTMYKHTFIFLIVRRLQVRNSNRNKGYEMAH